MEKNIEELVGAVRQIAYAVHVYLANGYLEKVYENCLRHRLEKAGHKVEAQKNLKVYDEDGFEIGDYFADLIVDEKMIVELKSAKALSGEHYAQILNYLKITGLPVGLLINFGSYKFETRTVVPNFDGRGDYSRVEVERCRTGALPQTPRILSPHLPLYTAKTQPPTSTPLPLYSCTEEALLRREYRRKRPEGCASICAKTTT